MEFVIKRVLNEVYSQECSVSTLWLRRLWMECVVRGFWTECGVNKVLDEVGGQKGSG